MQCLPGRGPIPLEKRWIYACQIKALLLLLLCGLLTQLDVSGSTRLRRGGFHEHGICWLAIDCLCIISDCLSGLTTLGSICDGRKLPSADWSEFRIGGHSHHLSCPEDPKGSRLQVCITAIVFAFISRVTHEQRQLIKINKGRAV
ncbi:hypothetical protein U1Q18_051467 [Sarracenia purpurea var. burkii]